MKIINHRIIDTLKNLDLPIVKFAVFGSAIMDVYGLKQSNDIDLILSDGLFDELQKSSDWKTIIKNPDINWQGLVYKKDSPIEIEAFKYFPNPNYKGDFSEMISGATIIDGLPFVSIENVLKWKKSLAREKDLKDIELINGFMSSLDDISANNG
jgi:predicted nucleotidyltransferase